MPNPADSVDAQRVRELRTDVRARVTYVGERFVLLGDRRRRWRRLVFRLRVQFGRGVPHHAQFRSVHEILVPVGGRFHVGPVEVRYYLGGERYPRVDATETVGTSPRVARRIVRF